MKPLLEKIPFKIVHMDGLGQGVSKILDKTAFISKTLPNEEGLARPTGHRKQVYFAQLDSPQDLQNSSPMRIPAECPHFDQCPGCHYLHTSYPMELQFKQDALNRELRKLKIETPAPILHPSEQRSAYRNRITLHYNKTQDRLGIFSATTNEIIPIPHCRLPILEIQHLVTGLYQNQAWQKLAGKQEGHLEIYKHPVSGLHTTADAPNALVGFSQVHQSMNDELTEWIKTRASELHFQEKNLIVDLFGGDGNLTKKINFCDSILVVDKYRNNELPTSNSAPQQFYSCDLYNAHESNKLRHNLAKKILTHPLELMIIDPPRSGFTLTATLAKEWKPTNIFYVSCAPDTLMRDIKDLLPLYSIRDVHLFDMFPGTFHFETVIHLISRPDLSARK